MECNWLQYTYISIKVTIKLITLACYFFCKGRKLENDKVDNNRRILLEDIHTQSIEQRDTDNKDIMIHISTENRLENKVVNKKDP